MLIKRSISISGHRTSLALEPDFWAVLDTVAVDRKIPFAALIREIDEVRAEADPDQPLSSACRVFALNEAVTANRSGPGFPPRKGQES